MAGQCTEAAILGSLCWLGMLVLHFPYAPMIGALVGISALIPIVGAFVGLIVGAFMIMMVDPMQAIWFIIFLLILQQIEGNLIYPRVVGTSVGLPAIWVLAAVTVGGGLFGIVGMLFAVPMMSIIYALTRRSVNKRLVEKDKLL
ncbi:MAG: AI-2E family transporter [Oscillospiraceae bacterium]